MWSKLFSRASSRPDALETYKIKDLYEAAFLVTRGARLLKLERRHRQLIFVLRVAQRQQDAVDALLSDQAVPVNLRRFGSTVGTLERRAARWKKRH